MNLKQDLSEIKDKIFGELIDGLTLTYTNPRRFECSGREEMAMIEYLEILVLGKRSRWKKLIMTSLWIFYVKLTNTYLEREEEELPMTF